MKCDICKATLAITFLEKVKGTYVKDTKGKMYAVCFDCQKKVGAKEELLKQL